MIKVTVILSSTIATDLMKTNEEANKSNTHLKLCTAIVMDQSFQTHLLQTASFVAVAGHPFTGQGQSRLLPLNVQATLSSV